MILEQEMMQPIKQERNTDQKKKREIGLWWRSENNYCDGVLEDGAEAKKETVAQSGLDRVWYSLSCSARLDRMIIFSDSNQENSAENNADPPGLRLSDLAQLREKDPAICYPGDESNIRGFEEAQTIKMQAVCSSSPEAAEDWSSGGRSGGKDDEEEEGERQNAPTKSEWRNDLRLDLSYDSANPKRPGILGPDPISLSGRTWMPHLPGSRPQHMK